MEIITSENFESFVLKAEKPVMVEFFSDGCIPCRRMAPILAELDEKYDGLAAGKLNIKFGIDTARKYNVMASPTIIFFKNGEEVKRIKGLAKKDELEAAIGEVLL